MKTYQWDGISIRSERPLWLQGDNVVYVVSKQELHITTPDGKFVAHKGDTIKQDGNGSIFVERGWEVT